MENCVVKWETSVVMEKKSVIIRQASVVIGKIRARNAFISIFFSFETDTVFPFPVH